MPIHLISGPMFAGKTTALIQALKKRDSSSSSSSSSVVLLKHCNDVRYPVYNRVVTHTGDSYPCVILQSLRNLDVNTYKSCSTIAVDEGQFFPDVFETTSKWANQGKEVIVAAISNGTFMEPLKPISKLMAVADYVTVLKRSCESCQAPANFNFRKTPFPEHEEPSSPSFFIGGGEAYEALCRRCFIKRIQCDNINRLGMFSGNGVNKLEPFVTEIFAQDVEIMGKG
jgi:thymidine kinase